jgi:hypothetical protein
MIMSRLVVIFLSVAAIPALAQRSPPTPAAESPLQKGAEPPRIGFIQPSSPPETCGWFLQFPTDYRKHNDRYVFRRYVDGPGEMNIDGRNVQLTMLRDEENKGAVSVGDRFFQTYGSSNLRVRIDYIVTRICDPKDEGCEVTWYSATITVTRRGSSRRAGVLGVCGC